MKSVLMNGSRVGSVCPSPVQKGWIFQSAQSQDIKIPHLLKKSRKPALVVEHKLPEELKALIVLDLPYTRIGIPVGLMGI
ncbi:unnamed protein product [Rhizophagus irregularis]|nr:unnamed protein product [Rhizophagus irregularis]